MPIIPTDEPYCKVLFIKSNFVYIYINMVALYFTGLFRVYIYVLIIIKIAGQ